MVYVQCFDLCNCYRKHTDDMYLYSVHSTPNKLHNIISFLRIAFKEMIEYSKIAFDRKYQVECSINLLIPLEYICTCPKNWIKHKTRVSQMLKVSPSRTTLFFVSWELQTFLGSSQSWQWMPSVCWEWSGDQNRTPPKHRNFLGRSSVWNCQYTM